MRKLVSAALLMFITAGCASKSAKPQTLTAETSQEVAIGQQIHSTILQSFYPYTDPKVVQYVNRVGSSLAEHSERRELPYRFTILYSDKIYATSAPGGFVYITTGFLHFLDNEAELAAVLGHEIGQLQARDPQNSRARSILDSISKGGMMVGPAFGSIGALAAVGLATVSNINQPAVLTPERKAIEADEKALHYMLNAEQDPQGMMELFHRILEADNEVVVYFYDYFKARPITMPRLEAYEKAFSKLDLTGKTFETHRETYQQMTRGVREMYKQ